MPDGDKQCRRSQRALLTRLSVFENEVVDGTVAAHFGDDGVHLEINLRIVLRALNHDV